YHLPTLRPPRPTLFPYTTLFRSEHEHHEEERKRQTVEDTQDLIGREQIECVGVADAQAAQPPQGHGCGIHRATDADLRLWLHEEDRKSTRLNSSHDQISYAVFCL